jgi:hypothetical protein
MALVTKLGAMALAVVSLSGCGQVAADTMLLGSEPIPAKVRCPGDHEGFYVCMQSASQIDDAELKNVMLEALGQLAVLVNGAEFQEKIEAAFTNGPSIVSDL